MVYTLFYHDHPYWIVFSWNGLHPIYRVKKPINPHTDISYKADDQTQAKPMDGFLVEPEIYTHRRRRNGRTMRPYMQRHPKMVSVKFGKAKIRTIDVKTEDDSGHVDTPRPQLFSNQELVNLSINKVRVYSLLF